MQRTAKLFVAILAIGAAATTAIAVAASSPTVATGAASGVTDTTALLHAIVNPGGSQTSYVFQYGPTTSLGLSSASRSAGHGHQPLEVTIGVKDLTPGTVYYYHVVALNGSGGATGAIKGFKTTGKPPASAVTGPAVSVGKYQATPTASVNPQGAATTWRIQYGLDTNYTVETLPMNLAPVSSSLSVSVPLLGLAPGKLFHYRVVANNASGISPGADQTFFTFPAFRRTPRMRTHTSPSHLTRKPYTFTATGSLHGADFVPASLRCTGELGVRVFAGSRQVAFVIAQVQPDCTFSTPIPFNHLIGGGSTALAVKIHFRGNGYLKAVDRTDNVTLG